MKKVAVFIKKYSIGKSSPVVCMLDLLSDNYEVDLYMQNVGCTNADVLKKKNMNLIELRPEGGLLMKLKYALTSLFITDKKYIGDRYDIYLCFDPHGFFLCKQLFPEARPFYYSLELYFKDNHFNLEYPEDVMNKERAEINTIKGLIIQSQEREMLFRKEYNLSSKIPTLLLPVTYLQSSVKERSHMFRGKYNISDDKKIALHLGGIQEYHSCIELALTFSMLDNWVLIFHGYYFGEYIDRLKRTLNKNNINNVFVSTEVYDRIEDMDRILMSCDVGIAWFNNVSPNFTTSGKSSGKIAAYLRFGLPVIANKYNSTLEAVEQTGCGICVDDFDEIKDAVLEIEKKYDYYSDNCRKEYDKIYWFENYRKGLIDFIER